MRVFNQKTNQTPTLLDFSDQTRTVFYKLIPGVCISHSDPLSPWLYPFPQQLWHYHSTLNKLSEPLWQDNMPPSLQKKKQTKQYTLCKSLFFTSWPLKKYIISPSSAAASKASIACRQYIASGFKRSMLYSQRRIPV